MFLYAVAMIAFHDLTGLEAEASTVAGSPVTIDRRLRLAQCAADPVIARTASGLSIACTASVWRILASFQRLVPKICRGDPVQIAASGPGFSVTIDGIAEADAAPGTRLRVRDASGSHSAVVRPDGSLAAPGYNLP